MARHRSILDSDIIIGSFDSITTLKNIDTTNGSNFPSYCKAYVEGVGEYYFNRTSTLAESLPNTVTPTVGVGRWVFIGGLHPNNVISKITTINNIAIAASTSGGSSYTQGAGISITGNSITVDTNTIATKSYVQSVASSAGLLSFSSPNKLTLSSTSGQYVQQIDNLGWNSSNNALQINTSSNSLFSTIDFISSNNSKDSIAQTNLSSYSTIKINPLGQLEIRSVHFPSSLIGYAVGSNNEFNPTTGCIIKTIDGGLTWSTPSIVGTTTDIYCVYFTSNTTGFVTGFDNTAGGAFIAKTIDGGNSWTYTNFIALGIGIIYSISFIDANNGLASSDSGYFFKTIDGGSNWTPIIDNAASSNIPDIQFITSNIVYAVGDTAFLKSTNGGTSWTTDTIDGNISQLSGLSFINQNIGYVVGLDNSNLGYVAKTLNGGGSWTVFSFPTIDANLTSVSTIDANTAYIIGFNTSDIGYIFKTIDGGSNWTSSTLSSAYHPNDIYFRNSSSGVIVGDNYAISNQVTTGNIFSTVNSGSSWNHINVSGIGTLELTGVYFTSSSSGYAVGSDTANKGVITNTVDGGNTWSFPSQILTARTLKGITYNNNILYAFGSRSVTAGVIYKSVDNGITWTATNLSTITLVNDMYFTSSTFGYAVGNSGSTGKISRTTNGGTTWTSAATLISVSNTTSLNSVCFTTTTTGYIAGGNGSSGVISTTTNGTSFSVGVSITGTSVLSSLVFSDVNTGYAVGKSGSNGIVVKTSNAGSSWSTPTILSPSTNIYKIISTDATTLYAVGENTNTLQGLVFKSSDSGATWTLISSTSSLESVKLNSIFNIPTSGNKVIVGKQSTAGSIQISSSDFITASGLSIFKNGSLLNKGTITNIATPTNDYDVSNKLYIDTLTTALSNNITTANNQISALQGTTGILNNNITTINSNISTINSSINSINVQIAGLQTTSGGTTTFDTRITQLESTSGIFNSKINTLQSTSGYLNSSITTINSQITSLQSTAGYLTNNINTIKGQITALQSSSGVTYSTSNKVLVSNGINGTLDLSNVSWNSTSSVLEVQSGLDLQSSSLNSINSLTLSSSTKGNKNIFEQEQASAWNSIYYSSTLHTTGSNCMKFLDEYNGVAVLSDFITGVGNGTSFIFKTSDGGTNWSNIIPLHLIPGAGAGAITLFYRSIHAFNKQTLFILAYDSSTTNLYKSIDQGLTWKTAYSTSTTNISAQCVQFITSNVGYLSGLYTNNTVFSPKIMKSVDGGTNWNSISTYNGTSGSVKDMQFVDSNTGYTLISRLGSANNAELYKTIDSGTNWSNIYTTPTNYFASKILFLNTSLGFILGTNINTAGVFVAKTINGGSSWNMSDIPPLQGHTNNGVLDIVFTDSNTGHFTTINTGVGPSGVIYSTIDAGSTWTPSILYGASSINSIAFPSTRLGYALAYDASATAFNPSIHKTWSGGFDRTAFKAKRVHQSGLSTSSLGMISNLDTPMFANDVANKDYVDTNVNKSKVITDSDTITKITTTSNWTGVVYTGPSIIGETEGKIYKDSSYFYIMYSATEPIRYSRS